MPIIATPYGQTSDNQPITKFCLTTNRAQVELINYGATITSIRVPDRNNNYSDVALGHSGLPDYESSNVYLGAVCGRVANRIRGARFVLDGETYHVTENVPGAHLHGGIKGFNKKIWDSSINEENNSVSFTLKSPDGEEGYPGDVHVSVQYSLEDSESASLLRIQYTANAEKPTVINLTNHSYFNLGGHNSGRVDDHVFELMGAFYTPLDESLVPNGEIRSVGGTPFDFRIPRLFSQAVEENEGNGFDLNYCYGSCGTTKLMARVVHPPSGRVMTVESTHPGVQFYSGNYLIDIPGKDESVYNPHGGFCLETQNYPDAINNVHSSPSAVLRPCDVYHHETTFTFSVGE